MLLVTGCAGFIGSNVVAGLNDVLGHDGNGATRPSASSLISCRPLN